MSRLVAITVAALALAAAFTFGRATSPQPANAAQADARIADVVAQLRYVNTNLRALERANAKLDAIADSIGRATNTTVQDQLFNICLILRTMPTQKCGY